MWSSLDYFAKVAELGSFSAAARALRISQPSLSVAVQKLEEQLGTTLLLRHARGVKLTSAGEVLLREARHAFAALDQARQEIHGLEQEPKGRFVLGCHESLGAYFLPGFMGDFLSRHAAIELVLWNANSRDVHHAVLERRVDLGIVVNAERHPDCVVKPMFDDRVAFVVAATLLRRAPKRPLDLLESRPLLHVPALRQTQYLLASLAKDGIAHGPELPCQSLELVKSLVLDSVGVGILPMRVAGYGVASGRLAALSSKLPHFDDHVSLVYRADAHRTHAFKLLVDAVARRGATVDG